MNKRDELGKEKFLQRGHSRGKSYNVINLTQLSYLRESSRPKDTTSYSKINPSTLKTSKMTPDESFRLRAKNPNENRADILLSRSNSDFANVKGIGYNGKQHLNFNINPDTKLNMMNTTVLGNNNNLNYTNYNMFRDSSNSNFLQQKNSQQNIRDLSNSKLNASVSNNNYNQNNNHIKIHRSPIDPRKNSKVSPIRPSFNVIEKSTSPIKDLDMFRITYNLGSNGLGNSLANENSKNKLFNNGKSANPSVVSRSTNLDINGMNEGSHGMRNYLPNMSGKNTNGREKDLYNGGQHFNYSEKKENEYYSINNGNSTNNKKSFLYNDEKINNVHNSTNIQFYNNQQNGGSQSQYGNKSFINSINNHSDLKNVNFNNNIGNNFNNNYNNPKTSNSSSINYNNVKNQNQINKNLNLSKSKYNEKYSDQFEFYANSKNQDSQFGIYPSNLSGITHGIKRRTESYSKVDLQQTLMGISINKENRDLTPNSLHKRSLPLHERKKSFESKKGLTFLDNADSSIINISSNNIKNITSHNYNIKNPNTNFMVRDSKGNKLFTKIYAGKSKAGRLHDGSNKTNQDSYLIKNKILNLENFSMFGVFDGHGNHGHFISNMIKHFFSEYFSKPELYLSPHYNSNTRSSLNPNFKNNFLNMANKTNFANSSSQSFKDSWNRDFHSSALSISGSTSNIFSPTNPSIKEDLVYEKIKERNYAMLKNSFNLAESSISMSKYDVNFSGSTCILIFLIENKLICANAGDSRAILVSQKGNADSIIQLSRDHKPELKDEMYRINRLNGRVDKYNDNGIKTGPFRVWLKNQNYPGLAMSRSIGDLVAGSVGVICEPEIYECEINERNKFIVIASDGVWEFLSNERVADIVNPFYYGNMDVNAAAEKLVEEATKCWRREDESVDDISVVVLFFHAKA